MVALKTKSEKHANDNEKRRQSIKEREKAKLNQSKIIKNALSESTLNKSKKLVFSDEENEDGSENKNVESSEKNVNGNEKTVLFGDSESENDDFDIREKTQFKGKKGFELLYLQSTYGNDERFKIDERFLEDEKDEDENKSTNETSPSDEKTKQLKILGSVLGTPDAEPEKEKKSKKRTYEMIRYDASKKEHEVYEIKTPSNTESSVTTKSKKEDRKRRKVDNDDTPRPKVSKEKFYEVSNEIKNQFKEKQNEKFSLLETYGSNGAVKNEEIESEENSESDSDVRMNEKTAVDENLKKEEENKEAAVAKGIWKESFFFVENDERFKEALEFINKKDSEEALEAAENFNKTRRKLKEILRLRLKKQTQNKNPFKNKVGGMNKKQLANSKFKTSKFRLNNRKPYKKNRGGKI